MTAERIGPDFAGIAGAMSITSCPAKVGPVLTAVVCHRQHQIAEYEATKVLGTARPQKFDLTLSVVMPYR